ncbi:MAG: signal transduction histidine kinase [Nitrospinales bacterium]|jgi:signal transduction histidine kinase
MTPKMTPAEEFKKSFEQFQANKESYKQHSRNTDFHFKAHPKWMNQWIIVAPFLVLGMIASSYYSNMRMISVYAPLIDAASRIKYQGTLSHLWFEEYISGDKNEKKAIVLSHLDKAEWNSHAMLDGGTTNNRTILPLEIPEMRKKITIAIKRLREFREIIGIRSSQKEFSQPGTEIDQQFDKVFKDFLNHVEEVQVGLKNLVAKELYIFQVTQAILIIMAMGIFIHFGVTFKRFNLLRTKAYESLFYAHRNLEIEIKVRREMEGELRQRQSELAQAQKIAQLGNWVSDSIKNELRWSDQIYQIFDVSRNVKGVDNDMLDALIVDADRDKVIKARFGFSQSPREALALDYAIRLPDGGVKHIHEHCEATIETNDSQQPLKVVGTIQDVTEQKHTEHKLKHYADQLRCLNNRLQSIREEEKNRIAREVHDELGQVLTVLRMEVLFIIENTTDSNTKISSQMHSISSTLEKTIGSVQRICTELRPQILDTLGIVNAIAVQAKDFGDRTGIETELVLPNIEIEMSPGFATMVFRIFQETLTNAARHSKASKIIVQVDKEKEILSLTIKDNGIGLDREKINNKNSLGLLGIKERAETWGGEIIITSSPGIETCIKLRVPLENNLVIA